MSTKYSTGDGNRLLTASDGRSVALTDHALHRWRMRTPPTCQVTAREAWRRGEELKHPAVVRPDGEDESPDMARVYRHGDEWGIVFVVIENDEAELYAGCENNGDLVAVTVCAIQTFDHGPTRAYLHGYGPHYTAEAGER